MSLGPHFHHAGAADRADPARCAGCLLLPTGRTGWVGGFFLPLLHARSVVRRGAHCPSHHDLETDT